MSLMMINVFYISYCRMLKGDGFDYGRRDRPTPRGELSEAKKNSREDWFSNGRKQFHATRSSDKLNVSDRFSSLINQALASSRFLFH